jgi:hypothetical protein
VEPLSRWAVVAAVIAVVLSLGAIGLVVGPGEFATNLLVEFIGIAVSVLVAVALVERLLRRQRAQQWERVRAQTLRSIYATVTDIAAAFYLEVYSGAISDSVGDELALIHRSQWPTEDIADRLAELAEHISANADELGSSTEVLHNDVGPAIRHMRDAVTPRVIEVAEDPTLVEKLVELEDAERRWAISLGVIDDWGAPETFGWEDSAGVLDAAAEICRYLARLEPPPSASHRFGAVLHKHRPVSAETPPGSPSD